MKTLLELLEERTFPVLEDHGLELVDLELGREGSKLAVRYFVDRKDNSEGGVSVEECGDLNLALGRLLDVEDIIPESYVLEVSSPGVDRRLRKLKDFREYLGEHVRVITNTPVNGSKKFKAELLEADEQGICISRDGEKTLIPHELIKRANLIYGFDDTNTKQMQKNQRSGKK